MMSTLSTILPAMLGDATGPTFWMPEAASSVAGEIDWILEFINIISYVFFAIIVFALVYLAIKYRRDPSRTQISGEGPTHGLALELTWTIIPTLLVVVIFWVGMVGYIDLRYPEEVRELKTSGKRRRAIVDDHAFQVSTYAMAIRQETGRWPRAVVDYICPTGMESIQLKNGKRWVREVVETAARIRALLADASSEAELCRSVKPNFSHWLWNYRPKARAAAQELFQTG